MTPDVKDVRVVAAVNAKDDAKVLAVADVQHPDVKKAVEVATLTANPHVAQPASQHLVDALHRTVRADAPENALVTAQEIALATAQRVVPEIVNPVAMGAPLLVTAVLLLALMDVRVSASEVALLVPADALTRAQVVRARARDARDAKVAPNHAPTLAQAARAADPHAKAYAVTHVLVDVEAVLADADSQPVRQHAPDPVV